MAKQKEEKYASVSLRDIEDLTAIYEDYLYMARYHELLFLRETIDELSFRQIQYMYPECQDPIYFVIPWEMSKLNVDEMQEFADYIKNNIAGDGHKTYVSLQHIRAEDNNGEAPVFAISPYKNTTVDLMLPSLIESYMLSYPEGATLGNTEFHIDGRYKTIYRGEKGKDKLLADCVNDTDLLTEITIMLNLGESYRQNGYVEDEKFGRMAVNVYTAELVAINENNLLELIGSFADKVRRICYERYHEKEALDNIKRAQEEGFLNLPSNFQDYVNIRNFMRHQWDTLEDLDNFSLQKSEKNKRVRAERAQSFLKFYDKTLYQRMVSCIEVLHQMQQIIKEVKPDWVIRDMSESNTKFMERVKLACRQHPDKQITVEMNYQLNHNKYEPLNKVLHKKKLFPNVRVVDDFNEDNDKIELMEDYKKRSAFLLNCHGIECYAMGYCQRRGLDKNNRRAWFYLRDIGLITPEECQTWQDYISLRNDLVHSYFDVDLRKRVNEIGSTFEKDFRAMAQKIYDANPQATKLRDDVYEYAHDDGNVTICNYASHDRTVSESQETNKIHKSGKKASKESYRSGLEFKVDNKTLVGVKLPNGVYVNMDNQSINWGDGVRWYISAEKFNALQTPKSTIRTDKKLKVTKFFTENHPVSFRNGDNLLLDYRYRLLIDHAGRIKEFNFKNTENKIIKTRFKPSNGYQPNMISFDDGTDILFSEKEMTVVHDNQVLDYDNRKEFSKTYDTVQIPIQEIINSGNNR